MTTSFDSRISPSEDFMDAILLKNCENYISPLNCEQNSDSVSVTECGDEGDIDEPFLKQEFDSIDDAYDFYNLYALCNGFGIRKSSSSKSQATKKLIWKRFECNKSGMKKVSTNAHPEAVRHRDTRVDCKASLDIRKSKHDKWIVTRFTKEHNHLLDTPRRSKRHRSHKIAHKNPIVKKLMDQLHGSGMGPSRIAKTLNATGETSSISAKNVSYHLREFQRSNIGCEGAQVYKYLQKQKELDQMFYFAIELDNDGILRSIFWADSRARRDFLIFNDVIVFDVTYRTNRFMMPFAPFTGVNHHRQSILFGCALLSDETEETFVWLFQHWLHCMFDKSPGAIITDMDGAMYNAIKKVFPMSRHRFCSWHIRKHLLEHVHAIRDNDSEFAKDYKNWYNSRSISSSEIRWKDMIIKYQIDYNSWLVKMWDRRYHWVPAFLKDIFVAGMSSSSRSESINSFFDGFVNSNTNLCEFLEQYEKALLSRRQAEENEDFMTMNSKATLITTSSIEAMAGELYTKSMFKLFQFEYKLSLQCWHKKLSKVGTLSTYSVGLSSDDITMWCVVSYDDFNDIIVKCDCAKLETSGYICMHILHILEKKHQKVIPTQYILKRWTIGVRYMIQTEHPTVDTNEKIISPMQKWILTTLGNKVIEKASSSCTLYHYAHVAMTGLLQKLEELDIIPTDFASVGNEVRISMHSAEVPGITIRDPIIAKTKGRPKVASRITSGLESSQVETKKRTCGACGGKGHYATTCPHKKKDKHTREQIL